MLNSIYIINENERNRNDTILPFMDNSSNKEENFKNIDKYGQIKDILSVKK